MFSLEDHREGPWRAKQRQAGVAVEGHVVMQI